jgi:hypothetical protein
MAHVLALDGGVRLVLEEVEVALLLSLAGQMVDFVAPAPSDDEDPLAAIVGIDPLATTPDDPALKRLLPDAYADDAEAAGEFRRFTERGLREAKAEHARTVGLAMRAGGEHFDVTGDAIPAWLGFLNDTRLTLGTRLEITEDNHAELEMLPDDDPRAALFQVYDWLTFLQESIVQRLLPRA